MNPALNPILARAIEIANRYGNAAAQAFLQRFQSAEPLGRYAREAPRYAPPAPRFTPGSLATAPSVAPVATGMGPGTAGATIAAGTASTMRPPVEASASRGPSIPDEVYSAYTDQIRREAMAAPTAMPQRNANFYDEVTFQGPSREAPARAAVETARRVVAPTETPPAPAASESRFAGLFRDPYAGKSSRELYELYQQRGDDDPAMYARAASRQLEEQKAAGMAHGGAAEGGKGGHHKDAVVMKALEIIHHMLRGR